MWKKEWINERRGKKKRDLEGHKWGPAGRTNKLARNGKEDLDNVFSIQMKHL